MSAGGGDMRRAEPAWPLERARRETEGRGRRLLPLEPPSVSPRARRRGGRRRRVKPSAASFGGVGQIRGLWRPGAAWRASSPTRPRLGDRPAASVRRRALRGRRRRRDERRPSGRRTLSSARAATVLEPERIFIGESASPSASPRTVSRDLALDRVLLDVLLGTALGFLARHLSHVGGRLLVPPEREVKTRAHLLQLHPGHPRAALLVLDRALAEHALRRGRGDDHDAVDALQVDPRRRATRKTSTRMFLASRNPGSVSNRSPGKTMHGLLPETVWFPAPGKSLRPL